MNNVCMAVPCRNRTLFRREFRSHCCIGSAILLNFRQGRSSYALHRLIKYMHLRSMYEAALNGSSAIRCFKHSEAIEIRDGIIFDSTQDCVFVFLQIWDLRNMRSPLDSLRVDCGINRYCHPSGTH